MPFTRAVLKRGKAVAVCLDGRELPFEGSLPCLAKKVVIGSDEEEGVLEFGGNGYVKTSYTYRLGGTVVRGAAVVRGQLLLVRDPFLGIEVPADRTEIAGVEVSGGMAMVSIRPGGYEVLQVCIEVWTDNGVHRECTDASESAVFTVPEHFGLLAVHLYSPFGERLESRKVEGDWVGIVWEGGVLHVVGRVSGKPVKVDGVYLVPEEAEVRCRHRSVRVGKTWVEKEVFCPSGKVQLAVKPKGSPPIAFERNFKK